MSARLFILFCSLVLCGKNFGITGPSLILAINIQYRVVQGNFTWDEANEYCRENNLALAFILNEREQNNLKRLIKEEYREEGVFSDYWLGGRADGQIWRWDFGARSITFDGWHHEEPSYSKKDGVKEACMELEHRVWYPEDKLLWNDIWCDSPNGLICQNYD